MSKKSHSRPETAAKQRARLEREAFEAKKSKIRRITAIVTASVLAVLLLIGAAGLIAWNVRLNRGDYLRAEIAASGGGAEVDGAMMNYYFNDIYNTFVEYYGSYVEYYGLDTTAPLRTQYIDTTESWFDYFMTGAKDTVTGLLALRGAADAAGLTLNEAETAAVRAQADAADTGLYGRGTHADDIFRARSLEALAYKFRFRTEEVLAPDMSDINAYFADHAARFQKVDYLAFPLYYSENGMSEAEVSAWADKLTAAKSEDAFLSLCREVLLTEDPAMTEEAVAATLDGIVCEGILWSEGVEQYEWAFSAKKGSTYIKKDTENTTCTVYFLTAEAYRDERATARVRHILFDDDVYGSRKKAMAAAEAMLAGWQAAGAAEEAFALAALELTADAASVYNGGLYEAVAPGTMVEEFDAWCFDPARMHGDAGIIETDYGVHVMHYCGTGLPVWAADVSEALVSAAFAEYLSEIKAEYPVVFDENVLDMIPD